ncbi:MAG: dihydropteroate synthase [Anaerolineales bacterium]|uniref:Dihydropteroate synthase n=1 Tax=Candidatus Desulfolinea nitratireducens TaxID=2841698 RepID=A0A8J6NLT5_9CHLR|nr:dihydropteroate synthase [Candidatus Desulfolinea nitratireducens]MBL6960077.1 dihydropteroate synthase [Anaerolineales bacterium]
MDTILKSTTKEVKISIDKPFVVIGEKVNPTGRKILAGALAEGNYDYVLELVKKQVDAKADILDVNVGVPGLDEVKVLPEVAKLISDNYDLPLCLDSANHDALAAALAVLPGKLLINSVNGEEKSLEKVLPLVKEYGAAVIGLTMDDDGIPSDVETRVSIAGKIIERAAKLGISEEDIVIDPLVLTVGADSNAALVTLGTIDMIRKEFGVNINLGASNVSFGLPDRHTVNQAFLSLAISKGATCAITDPVKLTSIIRATDLLMGRDKSSLRYLKFYRSQQKK